MSSTKFRLAQLYNPCDCEKKKKHELHYITFDETFTRLQEVTDEVLKYFDNKGEVLQFVLGHIPVKSTEDSTFTFTDRKTWQKKELKDRKRFWEEKGYDQMVVIGCVEEDLIRDDAIDAMKDSEIYAIALAQRLLMHYIYNKPEERLFNDSLQLSRTSLEKTDGTVLYIAIKFKSKQKKEKSKPRRKWKSRSSSSSSSSSSSNSSSSDKSSSDSSSDDESNDSSDGSRGRSRKPRKEKSKHHRKGCDDEKVGLSDRSKSRSRKPSKKEKSKHHRKCSDDESGGLSDRSMSRSRKPSRKEKSKHHQKGSVDESGDQSDGSRSRKPRKY